jgi:4-amino-4-deoxy-L-arabinose transferase-like glycosyltransferase
MTANNPRYKYAVKASIFLGIMFLAGFLRLNAVYSSKIDKDLWADSHIYFTYAYNLRTYGVYSHYNQITEGDYSHSDRTFGAEYLYPPPDNYIPPGYPFFIYLFLDELPTYLNNNNIKPTLENVKLAQALLSTVIVLVTFLISRSLFGETLAFFPMLIVAISPRLIVTNLYILTETLFCFFLCLTVFLTGSILNRSNLTGIIIGALIAVASLIKSSFQYFIVFLGPLIFFVNKRRMLALLLISGFIFAYSPWLLRNQLSSQIVTGKNLMAFTLLAGAYPDLRYEDDPKTYPYPFKHDPSFEYLSRSTSSVLKEIFVRFRKDPVEMTKWYFIGKPVLLWKWDITHGAGGAFVYFVQQNPYRNSTLYRLTYLLSKELHSSIVILGLIGSIIVWLPVNKNILSEKTIFVSRVMSSIIFYFTFVHIVTFAEGRYATPLLPIVAMMAFVPIHYLNKWLTK